MGLGLTRDIAGMSSLDRLYAAFAEFMTPDENGEPLLLSSDVRHAVEAAGIPAQLSPELLKLMDPDSTGSVDFERFSSVCGDVVGHEAEDGSEDSSAGGFDPDDFDDDDDDDYEEDIEDKYQEGDDATRDHIFSVLSSNGRITVGSLRREADKLKFAVPTRDLQQMVEMASTKPDFARLWRHLQ